MPQVTLVPGPRLLREITLDDGTWRDEDITERAVEFLFDQLRRDAATPDSKRDFGGDIIPYIVKHGKAVAQLVPMPQAVDLFGALKGSVLHATDIVTPLDNEWDAAR